MNLSRYVEVCHCGHDKATHFDEQHTCLGMLCDCARYVDRNDPKPSVMKAAPVVEDVVESDVDTLPVIPVAHPMGCTCSVCAYMYGVP